jgi:hypothetical protein
LRYASEPAIEPSPLTVSSPVVIAWPTIVSFAASISIASIDQAAVLALRERGEQRGSSPPKHVLASDTHSWEQPRIQNVSASTVSGRHGPARLSRPLTVRKHKRIVVAGR